MESAELIALLHEVRDRVRARHPETAAGGAPVALPDLMPLVHARDAALGKVAAIGTVNPRPGGPVNSLVQAWKRMVARALDWHVREQVEFNRKSVACIDAALEALETTNRALAALGGADGGAGAGGSRNVNDIRNHWADWRVEWEQQAGAQRNPVSAQRGRFAGRIPASRDLMEANYRDLMRAQHANSGALERNATDIQKRLWADLERIRLDYERLIHSELRTIRQRAQITAASSAAAATTGGACARATR